MAEEKIEWAWAQSLMRFVHLGEQVRTKGGKLFTVQRIEEGPEPQGQSRHDRLRAHPHGTFHAHIIVIIRHISSRRPIRMSTLGDGISSVNDTRIGVEAGALRQRGDLLVRHIVEELMRCGLALLAILVTLTLAASGARANDGRSFYVFDSTSCGEYANDRKLPDGVGRHFADKVYVAGWLSAINWSYPDTYNITGRADLDSVMLWLDKFCREHPLEKLPEGLIDFVNESYPNRTKRSP
jgi:hypothetical protein